MSTFYHGKKHNTISYFWLCFYFFLKLIQKNELPFIIKKEVIKQQIYDSRLVMPLNCFEK